MDSTVSMTHKKVSLITSYNLKLHVFIIYCSANLLSWQYFFSKHSFYLRFPVCIFFAIYM